VRNIAGNPFMARQRSVIAVVDDDLDMLNTVASLLSAHGYGTEEYASAEEFLIAAAASKATCLVVDIQLGDISGVELMRQLHAIGSRCPVIFMTGSRDDVIRQQAMDLGCVSYLHKPFPASQLLRNIQKAIGSKPGTM
jgi:FixJ family two-component response regulator